jgi:signal transduction histidine kinase
VPLQSLPLWWRRRRPVAVLAVVAAVTAVRILGGLSLNASTAPVVFAVYAVSVYGGGRSRLWVVALLGAVSVVGVVDSLTGTRPPHEPNLLSIGPLSLVAWVIGDYFRSRRHYFAELLARSEAKRQTAVEEERLRIARELHDVVAHNVSVMAIQAGAVRMTHPDGEASLRALEAIEQMARDTLSELNRLLGVLRRGASEPARSPQPGLGQLEGLLKPARDAGLEATLKVSGSAASLPATLDLSAYRIVQEAVTNVLKHAQASRLEVIVHYEPDELVLTISDNGIGNAEGAAASGHGLIGMQERVELFGGELVTGSSSLGGFVVRARLPIR